MSSFCACRSQKHKKYSEVISLFLALLGSAHAKAAHRILMKLTPARHIEWKKEGNNNNIYIEGNNEDYSESTMSPNRE